MLGLYLKPHYAERETEADTLIAKVDSGDGDETSEQLEQLIDDICTVVGAKPLERIRNVSSCSTWCTLVLCWVWKIRQQGRQ